MRLPRVPTILEFALPCLLVAAWWFGSAGSESFYFPPLSTMIAAFEKNWLFARALTDVVPSLARLLAGYFLAVIVGVGVGMAIGTIPLLRMFTSGILDFFRSMPPVILIPFTIVVFGIGAEMKIFVIFFGAIWPILLNTIDGVSAVDGQLKDMARAFQLGRVNRTIYVTLAFATPQIFTGMRASLSISVILMVVSEMLVSTDGVGFFVIQSQRTFALRDMWSGIILLGLVGYILNLIFVLVENRVLHWHRGMRLVARSS